MDVPDVDDASLYLEAGYSLYCVDEGIYKTTDNLMLAADACVDEHNSACTGVWDLNIAAITSSSAEIVEYPFCYSGTTMYMEGFQWIQSTTCVIYLFPEWVLDTKWKYVLAVIGTVFLAIILEKFIQQRRKAMASMDYGTKRLLASAAFYGVQLTIGYVLMLIVMIYSVVLFLAVILGLVLGHILFNARDAIFPVHEGTVVGEDQPTGETNDVTKDDMRMGESIKSFADDDVADRSNHYQIQSANDNDNCGSRSSSSKKKCASKRKTIDQRISEASTPCCDHEP